MALLPKGNERNDGKEMKSDSCKARYFLQIFLSIHMLGKEVNDWCVVTRTFFWMKVHSFYNIKNTSKKEKKD